MEPSDLTNLRLTLALVVLSWVAWVTFQTFQLVRERGRLEQLKSNQEKPFQDSAKVRAQIDSINTDTARLAAQGNINAQLIVAELQKRGLTINAAAKTVPPASQ